MRPLNPILAIALAAASINLGQVAPAEAQMVVTDPGNMAQNVLQAARALQQVNNQIKQLENEVRMLASLDLQLAPEVTESIQAARELFDQAQAIRYNLDTIADDVRALYPDDYKDLGIEDMLKRSDIWVAQSRTSVKHLLEQQAKAANGLNETQTRTEKALIASGDAEGQTSAIQASNQMLGVLSQQLAQMQALQIAQSRTLAEERLEQAARLVRAEELRRKAFPTERANPPPPSSRLAF